MATLAFSTGKLTLLTFDAEALEAGPQGAGMLIAAQGELKQQDTALLEQFIHTPRECMVTIKDGETTVLDGRFHVTFFEVEADKLTALLNEEG